MQRDVFNRSSFGIRAALAVIPCAAALFTACSENTARTSSSGARDPTTECRSTRQTQLQQYHALIEQKKYWPAANVLRPCAQLTLDAELQRLVGAAEVESLRADIASRSATADEKYAAMQTLLRDYPAEGQQYAKQAAILGAQIDKANTARIRSIARQHGITVGMTADQVRLSSWGTPERINRTVTAGRQSEQWVYRSGNYVYFENGVVTAIQTQN